MKLTIEKITTNQRTSARTGKPFTSLGLITKEYGQNTWVSGFGNKHTAMWREGDVVDVDIREVVKDGKKYINFDLPDPMKKLEQRVKTLEDAFARMNNTASNYYPPSSSVTATHSTPPPANYSEVPPNSPDDGIMDYPEEDTSGIPW